MKRLLLSLALVATFLAAGCVGAVETHTDPGQTVTININQQFVIALGSNQTTGYSWQESYDQTMLELVEKIYKEEIKNGGTKTS